MNLLDIPWLEIITFINDRYNNSCIDSTTIIIEKLSECLPIIISNFNLKMDYDIIQALNCVPPGTMICLAGLFGYCTPTHCCDCQLLNQEHLQDIWNVWRVQHKTTIRNISIYLRSSVRSINILKINTDHHILNTILANLAANLAEMPIKSDNLINTKLINSFYPIQASSGSDGYPIQASSGGDGYPIQASSGSDGYPIQASSGSDGYPPLDNVITNVEPINSFYPSLDNIITNAEPINSLYQPLDNISTIIWNEPVTVNPEPIDTSSNNISHIKCYRSPYREKSKYNHRSNSQKPDRHDRITKSDRYHDTQCRYQNRCNKNRCKFIHNNERKSNKDKSKNHRDL